MLSGGRVSLSGSPPPIISSFAPLSSRKASCTPSPRCEGSRRTDSSKPSFSLYQSIVSIRFSTLMVPWSLRVMFRAGPDIVGFCAGATLMKTTFDSCFPLPSARNPYFAALRKHPAPRAPRAHVLRLGASAPDADPFVVRRVAQ
jgi:hypothetical protein